MSPAAGMAEDPAALTLREALADADADAPDRPTLVWGSGVAPLAVGHAPGDAWRFFTSDLATARAVGPGCDVGVLPPAGAEQRLVLRMPRSKVELDLMLRVAAGRLPSGGDLWLGGHQRDGIRSAVRPLTERIGPVEVVRTKRHCRVLRAALAPGRPRPPELSLDDLELRFEAPAGPGADALRVASLPGTFAHGRLDDGTARLLAVLDRARPATRAVDLGCGSGVLGAALAARRPGIGVELCDVSAAACESARRTLALNGLVGATVRLAGVEELPAAPRRQLAVTNPPFHSGRLEAREFAGRFAAAAADCLVRGGQLLLVANSHIGYGSILEARFQRVEVLWQDTRYKVWSAIT